MLAIILAMTVAALPPMMPPHADGRCGSRTALAFLYAVVGFRPTHVVPRPGDGTTLECFAGQMAPGGPVRTLLLRHHINGLSCMERPSRTERELCRPQSEGHTRLPLSPSSEP